MGKTSAAAKNKWNRNNYDRIEINVPKGDKETIKAHAETKGESVNGFIKRAIDEAIANDNRGGDNLSSSQSR